MSRMDIPQSYELVLACRECVRTVRADDVLDWTVIVYSGRSDMIRVAMCPHVPDGMTAQSPDYHRP